jgi:hypothetical protein
MLDTPHNEGETVPTVENITPHKTPLRHVQIVTANDGTRTLLVYGAVAAVLAGDGSITLPSAWATAGRYVATQRAQFLSIPTARLRAMVRYGSTAITVADIPVPEVWLDKYGPDSPDPYTVA